MRLSAVFYAAAAILAFLGVAAHEVIGTPKVLDPLDGTDLPVDVIALHSFSWHVGTVAVMAMIVMFVLAARRADRTLLAGIAAGMATGFTALGIGLALFENTALWGTPAPYAWAPVALCGWLGVVFSK